MLDESSNNGKDNQYNAAFIRDGKVHEELFRKMINVDDLGITLNSQEFAQLYRTIQTTFLGTVVGKYQTEKKIHGINLKSSAIKHSCCPNSVGSLTPSTLSTKIVTIAEVQKGGPLTINLCEDTTQYLTRRERINLVLEKLSYTCHCFRCLDPTELGTFTEGITCLKCRPGGELVQQQKQQEKTEMKQEEYEIEEENLGYYLPVQPLDLTNSAQWMCNLCKATKSYEVLNKISDSIQKELDNILLVKSITRSDNNMQRLERLIEENRKRTLRPNHYVLMTAVRNIIQLFDDQN